MVQLLALSVGPIKSIGSDNLQSGIDKKPVDRPLLLTKTGFIGDEQADKKHHEVDYQCIEVIKRHCRNNIITIL